MTALHDTLVRARARIASRERWTIRAEARDSAGAEVDALAPAAVRWDAGGALRREAASLSDYMRAVVALADAIAHGLGSDAERGDEQLAARTVCDFNDGDGHLAVLAAFDRAITNTTLKETD